MLKNVAGQKVGCQLVSKTTGDDVTTGTTTVYVTGDAGTQAAGSVGSGACTHEGNGLWTYAPAQAETNYDHIAFTFVNTSAVSATVQVYTVNAKLTAAAIAALEIVYVTDFATNYDPVLDKWNVTAADQASVDAIAMAVADLPTGEEIADFVWDELLGDHEGVIGSVAEALATAGGSGASATAIADAVWDEILSGHVVAGSAGEALANAGSGGDATAANQTAILARLPAALVGGRMDASVGAMAADVLTAAATNADFGTEMRTVLHGGDWAADMDANGRHRIVDGTGPGELDTTSGKVSLADGSLTTATLGSFVLAKTTNITGFNDLSASEVNAEVADVFTVDTHAEPGQGAPGATISYGEKIDWLYTAWRNKKDSTSSLVRLYADDGTTVIAKSTTADDGTTFSAAEFVSGP